MGRAGNVSGGDVSTDRGELSLDANGMTTTHMKVLHYAECKLSAQSEGLGRRLSASSSTLRSNTTLLKRSESRVAGHDHDIKHGAGC